MMFAHPLVNLFVCAMVLLCPAFCVGETAGHGACHAAAGERHESAHDPGHDHCGHGHDAPHHQHAPDGEPAAPCAHTCICTAGKPAGPPLQIPGLDLHPALFAHLTPADMCALSCGAPAVAVGPPPERATRAAVPLLI